MTILTLIAAVADNRVIGHAERGLPWSLPADLAHFKRRTWGHSMVMGRRTWDAIGRPLPGRRSLVVTRNAEWRADGAEPVSGLDAAIAASAGEPEVFIIGGAEIFDLALPRADRMALTHVHLEADGDALFPSVDWSRWRETWREAHPSEGGRPAFTFADYVRA
ncbi:dihydrofolate reductase [Thalassobaculum sp.]|uniref:dihydrofolate reductase n=1 Tax=Thalassobaculum sp. TaxID=2022740 RepID=UPI0032EE4798